MGKGNIGFDYGNGLTNCDHTTGIRYGVLPANEVTQEWSDSAEANYGDATCPKCGNEVEHYRGQDEDDTGDDDNKNLTWKHAENECADYACPHCRYVFGSESAFGDEPTEHVLDDGEYKASQSYDSPDIFILKSPYYTRAAFCSPCAPGACYLTSPCDDGEKAYCFGHDFFWDTEEKRAPYPVYRVSDDTEVLPEA